MELAVELMVLKTAELPYARVPTRRHRGNGKHNMDDFRLLAREFLWSIRGFI